ncbi:MAG: substrate-binding domain-containing protein [Spirochaetales bacterium]|nr:substrate-binding domain-containing protein [Spirochaetales bacterium]
MKYNSKTPGLLMIMFICVTSLSTYRCYKKQDNGNRALFIYADQTTRQACEELSRSFAQTYKYKLFIEYEKSAALTSQLISQGNGDLALLLDPYNYILEDKNHRQAVVAKASIAIVVDKKNPQNIKELVDLAIPEVSIGACDFLYSTSGYLWAYTLKKAGLLDKVQPNIVLVTKNDLIAAREILKGGIQAALIWRPVAFSFGDKLKIIDLPKNQSPQKGVDVITTASFGQSDLGEIRLMVSILKYSQSPEAAHEFFRFLQKTENQVIWEKHGFSVD